MHVTCGHCTLFSLITSSMFWPQLINNFFCNINYIDWTTIIGTKYFNSVCGPLLLRNIGHISPRCVRFFPRHPVPSLLELTLFLGATSPLLMPWTALNVRALSVIDIWCSPRMVRCHFARSRWCNDCQKGKSVATAVSTCVRRERTSQLNMLNASFLPDPCPARCSLYIVIYIYM